MNRLSLIEGRFVNDIADFAASFTVGHLLLSYIGQKIDDKLKNAIQEYIKEFKNKPENTIKEGIETCKIESKR